MFFASVGLVTKWRPCNFGFFLIFFCQLTSSGRCRSLPTSGDSRDWVMLTSRFVWKYSRFFYGPVCGSGSGSGRIRIIWRMRIGISIQGMPIRIGIVLYRIDRIESIPSKWNGKLINLTFFLKIRHMLSKIMKMSLLTLLRNIKHYKLAIPWLKAKKNIFFNMCKGDRHCFDANPDPPIEDYSKIVVESNKLRFWRHFQKLLFLPYPYFHLTCMENCNKESSFLFIYT